ncbi:hypothetical protein C8034_v007933 [Colletotrichum sidae]|uniref:Uncharacterized protein n=1 Tax=Colletotrichum sidae TaxID=1347389 RepID=A0A4R8T4U9_9PEZI|nr:hypothetical protein C8034_v007933 [Colletotrichum sidae]
MRNIRSGGALGALSALLWAGLADSECIAPDGQGFLKQRIVVVDRVPVQLSASLCSNTTITVAGTTVPVTNAPTVLFSNFFVDNTITYTSTLNPSLPFNGPFTTVTRGVPEGSLTSTLVLDPQGGDNVGTKIILDPFFTEAQGPSSVFVTGPSSNAFGLQTPFPGRFTAITAPWTGMVTTTLLLPPEGSNEAGTELVLIPTITPSTGPFSTLTGMWTGTVTSTVILPPAGTDTVGTQIVLEPTAPGQSNLPVLPALFIERTATWTGTMPTTLTIPPAGTGTVGTQLVLIPATTPAVVGPFTTVTLPGNGPGTTAITLPPSGPGTTGTEIVFAPLLPTSPGRGPFTGPFTTISVPTTGSIFSTATFAPIEPDTTGTEIVFFPDIFRGATSGPLTGPFTTLTAPGTGTAPTTFTLPPAGTDGTGTQIVVPPITARPARFLGPVRTVTLAFFGTVTTTLTVLPAEGDNTGTLIVLSPTPAPTQSAPGEPDPADADPDGPADFGVLVVSSDEDPADGGVVTTTYGGSVTFTSTFAPGPSGEPGSTVIFVPSTSPGPATPTPPVNPAILTSTYSGSLTSTTTILPNSIGGSTVTIILVPSTVTVITTVQVTTGLPGPTSGSPLDNVITAVSSGTLSASSQGPLTASGTTSSTLSTSPAGTGSASSTEVPVSPDPNILASSSGTSSTTRAGSATVTPSSVSLPSGTPITGSLASSSSPPVDPNVIVSTSSTAPGVESSATATSTSTTQGLPATSVTSSSTASSPPADPNIIASTSSTSSSTGQATSATGTASGSSVSSGAVTSGGFTSSSSSFGKLDNHYQYLVSFFRFFLGWPLDFVIAACRSQKSGVSLHVVFFWHPELFLQYSGPLFQYPEPFFAIRYQHEHLYRLCDFLVNATELFIWQSKLFIWHSETFLWHSKLFFWRSELFLSVLYRYKLPSGLCDFFHIKSGNIFQRSYIVDFGHNFELICPGELSHVNQQLFALLVRQLFCSEYGQHFSFIFCYFIFRGNFQLVRVYWKHFCYILRELVCKLTCNVNARVVYRQFHIFCCPIYQLDYQLQWRIFSKLDRRLDFHCVCQFVKHFIDRLGFKCDIQLDYQSIVQRFVDCFTEQFHSQLINSFIDCLVDQLFCQLFIDCQPDKLLHRLFRERLIHPVEQLVEQLFCHRQLQHVSQQPVAHIHVFAHQLVGYHDFVIHSFEFVHVAHQLQPRKKFSSLITFVECQFHLELVFIIIGELFSHGRDLFHIYRRPGYLLDRILNRLNQLIYSSSSITSLTPTTTTSQTSTFSGCVVTTTATAAAQCGASLPGTCAQLPTTNGLLPLTATAASCLLDLGPFGVGPVALCLTTNLNLLDPRGAPVADCLLTALRASCPQTLPQVCLDLQVQNGVALLANIPVCAGALGPYNSGAAAICLALNSITSATTGLSVFGCLQNSFNLVPSVTTITDPSLCPGPTAPPSPVPTCVTPPLPGQCLSLATGSVIDLVLNLPACTAALGGLGNIVGVATCVAGNLLSGLSVVTCLQDNLRANCIRTLPQVCLDLSLLSGTVDTALCVNALGPLAVGPALACLTSGLTSGPAIVQCLNRALFT